MSTETAPPSSSEKAPTPNTPEPTLLGQESISKETLQQISREIVASYQENPFDALKALSDLKRAGITATASNEKALEKKRVIFESLKESILNHDYGDDVSQFSTNLKHLVNIGALKKEDISEEHKERVTKAIQEVDPNDRQSLAKLSILCVDAKYIGAREDFSDLEDHLTKDLDYQRQIKGNEYNTALRKARLKYLGFSEDVGLLEEEKSSSNPIKAMFDKLNIPNKIQKLKESGSWTQFSGLKTLSNYLQGTEPLDQDTKDKALAALKSLDKKDQSISEWREYTKYAANLTTLYRQERLAKSTRSSEDETPEPNEENIETNIATNDTLEEKDPNPHEPSPQSEPDDLTEPSDEDTSNPPPNDKPSTDKLEKMANPQEPTEDSSSKTSLRWRPTVIPSSPPAPEGTHKKQAVLKTASPEPQTSQENIDTSNDFSAADTALNNSNDTEIPPTNNPTEQETKEFEQLLTKSLPEWLITSLKSVKTKFESKEVQNKYNEIIEKLKEGIPLINILNEQEQRSKNIFRREYSETVRKTIQKKGSVTTDEILDSLKNVRELDAKNSSKLNTRNQSTSTVKALKFMGDNLLLLLDNESEDTQKEKIMQIANILLVNNIIENLKDIGHTLTEKKKKKDHTEKKKKKKKDHIDTELDSLKEHLEESKHWPDNFKKDLRAIIEQFKNTFYNTDQKTARMEPLQQIWSNFK